VAAQLGEAFGIEAEVVASAMPFLVDQSGGFQDLQMLRYGGTAHGKPSGEFADGGRALSKQLENSLASWVRERGQQFGLVSHGLP